MNFNNWSGTEENTNLIRFQSILSGNIYELQYILGVKCIFLNIILYNCDFFNVN